MRKKDLLGANQIISASEIAQYSYCSLSWYLQKCGYNPISPSLKIGKESHINLGKSIDHIQSSINKSKILATVGFLFLIISLIMIIFKVVS